jgi:2-hydroxymuconate-semialdehyde hydrolase
VLLVHGAEDHVTPLGTAALPLLEHLADVRLYVLDRCGHVPALEHPHDFRQLLSCFLGREQGTNCCDRSAARAQATDP